MNVCCAPIDGHLTEEGPYICWIAQPGNAMTTNRGLALNDRIGAMRPGCAAPEWTYLYTLWLNLSSASAKILSKQ